MKNQIKSTARPIYCCGRQVLCQIFSLSQIPKIVQLSPETDSAKCRANLLAKDWTHWASLNIKCINAFAVSFAERRRMIWSYDWSSWLHTQLKAGVNVNSTIKRELLGLKWVGNTTRQLTPPNESPRLVGDRLVYVYIIHHFKFQFSKSIKSSTYNIFLNLTYRLRKNISFPKCPKITLKFTQNG